MNENVKSKITGGPTEKVFTATLLGKYQVSYYRCIETGYMQTEEPYWLNEAYADAIVAFDVGLAERNLKLSDISRKIIGKFFDANKTFLDYGGGYGLFVRIMRDYGINFYTYDAYAENTFARYFEKKDWKQNNGEKYEMITAFELMEHITNPVELIGELLNYSDSIFFSTELITKKIDTTSADSWWYFVPETGQHVSFFTKEALAYIANKYNCYLYTNEKNLHIISRKKLSSNPTTYFSKAPFGFLAKKLNRLQWIVWGLKKRKSLIIQDSAFVKKHLH